MSSVLLFVTLLSTSDFFTLSLHDALPISLEIGTVETVIKLPAILSTYHRNYPNVDLSLKAGVTKELIDQILKRKLDGAFVAGCGDYPEIEQVEVFQEKLVLISDKIGRAHV